MTTCLRGKVSLKGREFKWVNCLEKSPRIKISGTKNVHKIKKKKKRVHSSQGCDHRDVNLRKSGICDFLSRVHTKC